MKDFKEIVLYFKDGCPLVPIDIAKSVTDRFKEIGNPIVLNPQQNGIEQLVIFNENPEIRLTVSTSTVNIALQEKYFDELDTIIFDLVDLFNDLRIEFINIGIICSVFLSEKYKEIYYNKIFNKESLPDGVSDYNLQFFREIKFRKNNINCWERIITNSQQYKELLIQFDINCLTIKKIDLDMKLIREFLKTVDAYMEERLDS